MNRKIWTKLPFVVALIVLAGCAAQPMATVDTSWHKKVSIDSSIGWLGYDKLSFDLSESSTGLQQLQLVVNNSLTRQTMIDYRVHWIEVTGRRIDTSLTRWVRMPISAKTSATISAIAPNETAVDVYVEILRPKGVGQTNSGQIGPSKKR